MKNNILQMAQKARLASERMSCVGAVVKNTVLVKMAKTLRRKSDYLIKENLKDLKAAKKKILTKF